MNTLLPAPLVLAQSLSRLGLDLPIPGQMLAVSQSFTPVLIKGITIHPQNPLEFDFIVDKGTNPPTLSSPTKGGGNNFALPPTSGEGVPPEADPPLAEREGELKQEATKLIKYFLASLTIPDEDLWVNLSPYEKNRIVPEAFGQTEMGKDLLAQDYILKQLTASLMYPEKDLGKEFWQKVKAKAKEQFGVDEIPMNTFNKIWIVPGKAVVYEHGSSVFVVESRLRVMLENDSKDLSSKLIKDFLIPIIEQEVNEGKHFAQLRQIYNALILATWYKMNLKESLLGKVYVNQNKIKGVHTDDPEIKQKIYEQYLEAFQKGVYNYIKEEYDSASQEMIPKKYFSGGAGFEHTRDVLDKKTDYAMLSLPQRQGLPDGDEFEVRVSLLDLGAKADIEAAVGAEPHTSDRAMAGVDPSHWNPHWRRPTEQELADAKTYLERNSPIFQTVDSIDPPEYFVSSYSMSTEGINSRRSDLLRALYYLYPDIAGSYLVGFGVGFHGPWGDVIHGLRDSKKEGSLEAELIGAMLNRGLGLMFHGKYPQLKGAEIRIRYDLFGIAGIIGFFSSEQLKTIYQRIEDEYLFLLVGGMVQFVLYYNLGYSERRAKVRDAIGLLPSERLQKIFSKLSVESRDYLVREDKTFLPKLLPPPRVERVIPRVAGKAVGKLVIIREEVPSFQMLQGIPSDAIVAMDFLPTSDTRVGPFAGILTFRQEGETSHAQARASMEQIPHALWPGPEGLSAFEGQEVVLEVSADSVVVRKAEEEDLIGRGETAETKIPAPIEPHPVHLEGTDLYWEEGHSALADPQEVGFKMALLQQLASASLRLSDSRIQVHFLNGSAFPFRTLIHLLKESDKLEYFKGFIRNLNNASKREVLLSLKEIRDLIRKMNKSFIYDKLWEQFVNEDGFDYLENGVFVRTTTNVENLPQYPGFGSGMYTTVPNVLGQDNFWKALKEVWASVWSEEAYWERHKNGVDETKVYPAVWLAPSLKADYAFAIHTSNVSLGDSNQTIIEIVQGLGDSLVSNDSMFAGFPTHIVWDKSRKEVSLQTPSTKQRKSVLAEGGGTVITPVNPEGEFLENRDRGRLIRALTEVGEQTENFFGQPQEIEGALAYDTTTEEWTITLLQTRFLKAPPNGIEPRGVIESPSDRAMGEEKGTKSHLAQSDRAMVSERPKRTRPASPEALKTFEEYLKVLKDLGVKKGDNIVNVGTGLNWFIAVAAANLGSHYTGYNLRHDQNETIEEALSWFDLEAQGGSAIQSREFSSDSQDSKIHSDHSQDVVLMLTGVLSDPVPESDAVFVFEEALRVVKDKGRIVVGTVGMLFVEEEKTYSTIRRVLELPQWKGKVTLQKMPLEKAIRDFVDYQIFAAYEVNFRTENLSPEADSAMQASEERSERAKKYLIDLGGNFNKLRVDRKPRVGLGLSSPESSESDDQFFERMTPMVEELARFLQTNIGIHVMASLDLPYLAQDSFTGHVFGIQPEVLRRISQEPEQIKDFLGKLGDVFGPGPRGTLDYGFRTQTGEPALPVALFLNLDRDEIEYDGHYDYFYKGDGHLDFNLKNEFERKLLGFIQWNFDEIDGVGHDSLRRRIIEKYLNKLLEIARKQSSDAAMTGEAVQKVGGINFNPALLDMQIKRDGKGIPFPLVDQPFENMHIEGFLPVIIHIKSVGNLRLLLGVNPSDPLIHSSFRYTPQERALI